MGADVVESPVQKVGGVGTVGPQPVKAVGVGGIGRSFGMDLGGGGFLGYRNPEFSRVLGAAPRLRLST